MTDVVGPPLAAPAPAPVAGAADSEPEPAEPAEPVVIDTARAPTSIVEAATDRSDASDPTAGAGGSLFDQGDDDGHTADGPSPSVHPRLWQRRLAVLGDAGRKRLRWVVAGVAVLAAVCVALLVLHTPLLAVRHATVQGATHTGAAAVLQAAGLADHPPLIDVNPSTAAAQVEQLPWVMRAVVVRQWPDSVVVRVTERVPVGAFVLPGARVALVDATGRVLGWAPGPAPGPTLAGPVPAGRPGTDIAAADHPVLEVAAELPHAIAGDVIGVSVDRAGALSMTLGGRVTAVLGSADELPAKLTSLASVLADTRVTKGSRIDVTVPQEPVVRP